MRGDARVALRRVEMLVAEQLLDLTQVRTRVQELGRKVCLAFLNVAAW